MTVIVRWEEIICGDYEGEKKFFDTWEDAVDYMVKSNKKRYEIEVDD